jgi:putative salt-induced outer membrane protein YdiY
MSEKTILRIAALVGVVAVFGILSSASKQDEQRAEAVAKYEACVEERYKTTPAHYRLEHGAYPVCDSN